MQGCSCSSACQDAHHLESASGLQALRAASQVPLYCQALMELNELKPIELPNNTRAAGKTFYYHPKGWRTHLVSQKKPHDPFILGLTKSSILLFILRPNVSRRALLFVLV